MTIPTWQQACIRLWGDDWIAPLSEVLGVNRRTIERWRSGAVSIPDQVREMLERCNRLVRADREYGQILRRVAGGETPEAITKAMQRTRQALAF